MSTVICGHDKQSCSCVQEAANWNYIRDHDDVSHRVQSQEKMSTQIGIPQVMMSMEKDAEELYQSLTRHQPKFSNDIVDVEIQNLPLDCFTYMFRDAKQFCESLRAFQKKIVIDHGSELDTRFFHDTSVLIDKVEIGGVSAIASTSEFWRMIPGLSVSFKRMVTSNRDDFYQVYVIMRKTREQRMANVEGMISKLMAMPNKSAREMQQIRIIQNFAASMLHEDDPNYMEPEMKDADLVKFIEEFTKPIEVEQPKKTGKKKPILKKFEPTVVKEPTLITSNSPASPQMTKSQMKKARKQLLARQAEEVARSSIEMTTSKSPQPQNDLPDPVKCGLCLQNIQPRAEEYFRFTCGEDQTICSFPCHKDCLSKHYQVQKKHWKGQSCPTEACEKKLLVVYLVDKKLEETVFIKSDVKKTSIKPEVESKKVVKGEKKTEKKKEQTGKTEVVEERQELETEPIAANSATSSLIFNPRLANQSSPRIPADEENVVPLQKQKDEAEEKYSVPKQAQIVRMKTKKQKIMPAVAFETITSQKQFPTGFDTDFTCILDKNVTFPPPGTRGSTEFQERILSSIRNIIDDLPANLPEYEENKSDSVASLFHSLVKMTEGVEGVLSLPQSAYLKELAKVDKTNGEQLKKFVSGLKYYTVSYSDLKKNWQYQLNEQGQELQVLIEEQRKLMSIVDECVICMESILAGQLREKCKYCGRLFHTQCIKEWHKTMRNCPTCRGHSVSESEFPAI